MNLFGGRRKAGQEHSDDAERMHRAAEAERSGMNCLRDGNLEAAVVELGRCVALNPDHAVGHGYLGLALYRLGRLQEALASLETAIKLAPDDEVLLRTSGMILEALGRLGEASDAYSLAVRINPKSARAHAALGSLALRQGDLQPAESHVMKALEIDPQDPQALGELAEIRHRLGNRDSAIALLRKALLLRPQSGAFHYKLGLALEDHRELEESVASLRLAHELLPHDAEVVNVLGRVLMKLGRDSDVQQIYERAIRAAPEQRERYEADLFRLLVEYTTAAEPSEGSGIKQGHGGQAPSTPLTATRPTPADRRPAVGEATAASAELSASIATLETAIQLEPGNTKHYRDLSIQYMRAGRLREAKEMARLAEQLRGSGGRKVNQP